MKDSKERDIPGSPASSSSNTSSSGSSNVPPTQPNRGDMSDISDVSEGASSPVAAKGSRWLSKDSGSEEDDTVGARSGKMPKGKAVESAAQPSAFSHRSIGGYGIHEEEMSSESDGEVEVPATKEEMLKELGVVGEEVVEEEEEEEPSSPGTPPLPDYFPGIHGCRNVENYEWLNRIEEGTYGVVFRGRDKRTGGLRGGGEGGNSTHHTGGGRGGNSTTTLGGGRGGQQYTPHWGGGGATVHTTLGGGQQYTPHWGEGGQQYHHTGGEGGGQQYTPHWGGGGRATVHATLGGRGGGATVHTTIGLSMYNNH